jgi:hypothetical protein
VRRNRVRQRAASCSWPTRLASHLPRGAAPVGAIYGPSADLAGHGSTDMLGAFVRDFGTGPFVHILGRDWVFLEREKEKAASGKYGGSGVADMYDELRAALPIRYRNAPHVRARAKIEWMRDYINGVVDEYELPERP